MRATWLCRLSMGRRHGVALANDSRYGLTASVYSSDLKRGRRRARDSPLGQVGVNTNPLSGRPVDPLPLRGPQGVGLRDAQRFRRLAPVFYSEVPDLRRAPATTRAGGGAARPARAGRATGRGFGRVRRRGSDAHAGGDAAEGPRASLLCPSLGTPVSFRRFFGRTGAFTGGWRRSM